jgi:hypothetical protein
MSDGTNGKLLWVGDEMVTYDSEGRISKIGLEKVVYDDFDDRIVLIGDNLVRYNSEGKIMQIGDDKVMYDREDNILVIGTNTVIYEQST